jgi:4'-phosphopantetheinyl transferase
VQSLLPNEVHIWWALLDSHEDELPQCASLLSNDERKRADKFYHVRHRHRFIKTHSLLRRILGRYLDVPPDSLCFAKDDNGKPSLNKIGAQNIYFNLSHSHDAVLVGIAPDRPIGVDIEYIRPLSNMKAIAARFFSEAEYQAIQAVPLDEQNAVFFKFWTMKEACLKATGKGLAGLREVQMPGDAMAARYPESIVIADASEKLWSIKPLYPGLGYAAAVSVSGNLGIQPVLRQTAWHAFAYPSPGIRFVLEKPA